MVLERVQKIIANNSPISRRKAETLIEQGKVTVNDAVITIGTSADSQKDTIAINGKKLNCKHESVYFAMYKPKGYMTTVSDPLAKKKIVDLLPAKYQKIGLYPVGRLDIDAEGLIFFTNDGDFAHKVMHPSFELAKTYKVWLHKPISTAILKRIELGVKLKDDFVKDITARKITSSCVEITVHVGMHKVVKRIFDAFEFKVTRLVRIKIGSFELGSLQPGEIKPLSASFIKKIKSL